MEWVILERHETSDQGTFGKLIYKNFNCFTGELPWRENASSISCIPLGVYNCVYVFSPRFRTKTYLLNPVKNRTAIRVHSANLMGDVALGFKSHLNGCIALGERLGWIDKQKAVLLSKPTISKFEKLMNFKPFILEVLNA